MIYPLLRNLTAILMLLAAGTIQAESMTPERLISTLEAVASNVQAKGNQIEMTYQGLPLLLVFDKGADRMRLISPIVEVNKVDDDMLMRAMEANFHSALDARYAIGSDMVWAAFIHPLSDLSEDLLTSAVRQVSVARVTFGREYTSGALIFPGN